MSSATLARTPPAAPGDSAGSASTAASSTNAFVINLVSSTTPVALTRPDHAGLNRFTFFVSRRREDGRERFRLHMGYFDSQEEAEQLLDIVRSIYPGAWAGMAPGRRLAAAAAAASNPVPGAAPVAAPAASAVSPSPQPAVPVMAQAPAAAISVPAAVPAAVVRAAASPGTDLTFSKLALVPDAGRPPLADVDDVPAAAASAGVSTALPGSAPAARAASVAPAETPSRAAHRAARQSLSNIRAAIASLEDSGIHSPVLDSLPTLTPAVIPVAQPLPKAEAIDLTSTLTDTATLRLLETGAATREMPRPAAATASAAAAPATVTAAATDRGATAPTNAAKPSIAPREEKPYYAVQLVWSVQPIDMTQVPQLAIFGAYSLYGAEGNRDGRRWYGLRLGFFTDAVSAKQVAHYVRGDFATVSVVPVTTREREQALKAATAPGASAVAGAATIPVPAKRLAGGVVHTVRAPGVAPKTRAAQRTATKQPEFAFIEGTEPVASREGGTIAAAVPDKSTPRMIGGRPTRGAPGKRAKVRKPGQVSARTPVKPKTLEETLEILGANQLQVDDEPGPSINDSCVRHLRLETSKGRPSRLSRLINRLSERIGN